MKRYNWNLKGKQTYLENQQVKATDSILKTYFSVLRDTDKYGYVNISINPAYISSVQWHTGSCYFMRRLLYNVCDCTWLYVYAFNPAQVFHISVTNLY